MVVLAEWCEARITARRSCCVDAAAAILFEGTSRWRFQESNAAKESTLLRED